MRNRPDDDPIRALIDLVVFNPRDFAGNRFEAALYAIVCGWDDAMGEVQRKHGWTDEHVAWLERLHDNWVRLDEVTS